MPIPISMGAGGNWQVESNIQGEQDTIKAQNGALSVGVKYEGGDGRID